MKILFTSLFLTAAVSAERTSNNYTITAETLDFGGQIVASSSYAIQGSVGTVAGIAEHSSGAVTIARHGYVGQIYDLLGYGLLASDFYPPEEGSTQIIPVRTADDGTNLIIPTTGFIFTPLDGPIESISPTGLVETSSVHQDTQIMVGATSPAFEGELQLLLYVLDTLPDNFGTYAGDGLPDTWQINYFGHNNPLAAPLLDPDGDGQNNRFEYTAGIIPTDPLSRFLLSIEAVPGEPTHRNLKFSPVFGDRTYTVKSNTTIGGGVWGNLTDFADDNNNPERTITDQAATSSKKFYQVEITKP